MTKCVWCKEPLQFKVGKGWVHTDGSFRRTRIDADGVERDDHAALPNLAERERDLPKEAR